MKTTAVGHRSLEKVTAMGAKLGDAAVVKQNRRTLSQWRAWLPGWIAQTARYGVVGVGISLLYSGLTVFFVSGLGIASVLASLGSFVIALPISYFSHWAITFQRRHRFSDGWQRFAVLSAVGFTVAVPGMYVVTNVLNWSYLIGIAFSWVLVPMINYTLLQLWVFSHRRAT
ncbi:MAG: GtrA family protein [Aliidongia sp.]